MQIAECFSTLDNDDFLAATDPRKGIHTFTKFLPSVGDIHEFVRKRHEALDAVTARRATGYKYFTPEPDIEMPSVERRREIVFEALGRDPQRQRREDPPAFIPAPQVHGDHRDLRTPAEPASEALRKLINNPWPV